MLRRCKESIYALHCRLLWKAQRALSFINLKTRHTWFHSTRSIQASLTSVNLILRSTGRGTLKGPKCFQTCMHFQNANGSWASDILVPRKRDPSGISIAAGSNITRTSDTCCTKDTRCEPASSKHVYINYTFF